MAQGRGYLAAALATAMTVMPSLAPAQERVAAKPAPNAKIELQDNKPTLVRQAIDYSEKNPVVVIIVTKGSKDTITGEKIAETLSEVLKKGYQGVPSKSFVAEDQGPEVQYSVVGFAVAGHLYGPYGLKESLSAIVLPADNYWSKVQRGKFPPPETASTVRNHVGGIAAKPEPQQ